MAYFAKYIYIKGRRLNFYASYRDWLSALRQAKYYQKKLRNHYFILPVETFHTASRIYGLYMDRVWTT